MKWIICLSIGSLLSISALSATGKCRKHKEFISCKDVDGAKKPGFCLTKNKELPDKRRVSFCKKPRAKK